MKHKLLLGFILSSVLSTQIFALEIHGGKLIGHKEWTTGNVIKSSIKDLNSTAALKMPFHNFKQTEDLNQITVDGAMYSNLPQSTPINTEVTFRGFSFVRITNDTAQQKTYAIQSNLNVQQSISLPIPCPPSLASKISEDLITVDPNGHADVFKGMKLTTSFDREEGINASVKISVHEIGEGPTFNVEKGMDSIAITAPLK